jgi:hypothetical protein
MHIHNTYGYRSGAAVELLEESSLVRGANYTKELVSRFSNHHQEEEPLIRAYLHFPRQFASSTTRSHGLVTLANGSLK